MTLPAATPVGPDRTSSAPVVQAVGRRPADIARRPWESLAVFAVFTVLYTVLGHWLVVDLHVVGFETLERWTRALMVTSDETPKLAAIGVDHPPLSMLLLVPFAVVPAWAASLTVVPVVSAVFAALTLLTVNTMMRRAQVVLPARVAVLAALGLNPLVVLHATTGADDFVWLAFAVAALGALLAWYVTADVRFVMLAAVAFAAGTLAGYGSLVWFGVSLVMVAAVLARLGADRAEIEGTTVGLAAPTVYVVATWAAFNLVIFLDPLGWVTRSPAGVDLPVLEVVRGTGDLVLHGAPIVLVVLPALLHAGFARRNVFALWLAVLLVVTVLTPGVTALAGLDDTPVQLGDALPILLVAVVGGIWLVRSAVHDPTVVAGALALGLLASIPWTFSAMETVERQGLERAFHDAVATGRSQEGVRTVDGSYVGYDLERQMADYLTDHVDATSAVLTDDAATYAVILLTGAPDLFLDRVDRSDEAWARAAAAPAEHVRYLLLSVDTTRDRLSRLYPAAAVGDDPALETVFSNARYSLVAVPDGYRYDPPSPTPTASTGEDDDDLGGVDGVVGQPAAPLPDETDETDGTSADLTGVTP